MGIWWGLCWSPAGARTSREGGGGGGGGGGGVRRAQGGGGPGEVKRGGGTKRRAMRAGGVPRVSDVPPACCGPSGGGAPRNCPGPPDPTVLRGGGAGPRWPGAECLRGLRPLGRTGCAYSDRSEGRDASFVTRLFVGNGTDFRPVGRVVYIEPWGQAFKEPLGGDDVRVRERREWRASGRRELRRWRRRRWRRLEQRPWRRRRGAMPLTTLRR